MPRHITRNIKDSIVITLVTAGTAWGAVEAITYFSGHWLKETIGNAWIFVFIIFPIINGFIIRHLFIDELVLSSFDFINKSFLDKHIHTTEQSYFYYGASPTWDDVISGKDIERDLLFDILGSINDSSSGITLIPILASAGEGKTTFTKRLALELGDLNKVVLYRKRDQQVLRVEDVISVYERFKKHVYILIDDAALTQNFKEFVRGLADKFVDATIVASARPYDWLKIKSVYGENVSVKFGATGNEYSLDRLSNREIGDLIEVLSRKGVIKKLSERQKQLAIQHYANASNRSLLILVLQLTQNQKVNEIIRGEIEKVRKMGNEIFSAYRQLCVAASVNSYLSICMLKSSLSSSMVIQDFVNQLPGLVENIGDKIYIRHNLIGKITIDILFESNSDALGDQICQLIKKADDCNELDFTQPIHKHVIPKSQLVKVSKCLGKVLFCSNRFDILTAYFAQYDIVDYPSLVMVLAELTPFFIEELILPELPIMEFLEDYKELDNINFTHFECVQKANPPNNSLLMYEHKKQWADTYAWLAEWGPSDLTEFFTRIALILYFFLGSVYEDKLAECYYACAELAHSQLDDKGAIIFYKKALSVDPECSIARVGLIRSQYFEGDYESAFENYTKIKSIDFDKIFYVGEEEIIEEFLIRCGKLEEVIEFSLYRTERTFLTMRKMYEHFGRILEITDLSPSENGESDLEPEHISDPSSVMETYNEVTEKKAKDLYKKLLRAPRDLSKREKMILGKELFGNKFGELEDY